MTEWTEAERAAMGAFLASPGILRVAFSKFLEKRAAEHRGACARYMATVPRDPERAADYAAKAQELDEFWTALTDEVLATEKV